MNKFATVIASAVLAAPFIGVAPLSANAAKAKSYKFSYVTTKVYKAKNYHTKDNAVNYYDSVGAADRGYVTMTVQGKLKPSTTYKVNRTMKVKSFSTKKNHTFYYVKGHGWVQTSKLVKGAFHYADQ
ncbi:hypothetical protein YK48G_07810 [Lentilactobacillus fungorum]|uniref:Surface layer protein A domain-containing protein n=1 Tax=Lentilactobacillus fungorum TaxID=2201250 RepID=A0ABQ3VY39_9LACO|nr:signal peptide protein, YSIRK family [Lentilactobacillus fungorum]GHP13356.1 hypothetical protein YK48G_07810 [Lentilactobacillus fungorum]